MKTVGKTVGKQTDAQIEAELSQDAYYADLAASEGEVLQLKDGGLLSGSDGRTEAETADNIPARLSTGEYVMSADMVRWHGLEKIMMWEAEASAGIMSLEFSDLIHDAPMLPELDGNAAEAEETPTKTTPEGNEIDIVSGVDVVDYAANEEATIFPETTEASVLTEPENDKPEKGERMTIAPKKKVRKFRLNG